MSAVDALGWLTGSWSCAIWGGTFEETWLVPVGGVMMGVGRHVADGRTKLMEFMSIEARGDGAVLCIQIGSLAAGKTSAEPFELQEAGDGVVQFGRETFDYPSTIRYERGADGELKCELAGRYQGRPRQDRFEFRRV